MMETRDPNGLWCIEMAHIPKNSKKLKDEDSDTDEELTLNMKEFFLTADFDQNLNLL